MQDIISVYYSSQYSKGLPCCITTPENTPGEPVRIVDRLSPIVTKKISINFKLKIHFLSSATLKKKDGKRKERIILDCFPPLSTKRLMYISLKQYFCYKITKINYHICLNLINESANFLYCPNRVFKTKLSFFFLQILYF